MHHVLVSLNTTGSNQVDSENSNENLSSANNPLPTGSATKWWAGQLLALNQRGYGLSIRPFFDQLGAWRKDPTWLAQSPPNPADLRSKWVAIGNDAPYVPGLPGNYPLVAKFYMEDGSERVLHITDDRFYTFGVAFHRVDLWYPCPGLFNIYSAIGDFGSMDFLATVADHPDDFEGHKSRTLRQEIGIINFNNKANVGPNNYGQVVFFNDVPTTINLFENKGATYPLINGNIAGQFADLIDGINLYGFQEEMNIDGGTTQRLGAFFIFPQYKAFRLALSTTAAVGAQDIYLLRGTPIGFQTEEIISAANWFDSGRTDGRLHCLIEGDLSFQADWLLFAAGNAAANTIQVDQLSFFYED